MIEVRTDGWNTMSVVSSDRCLIAAGVNILFADSIVLFFLFRGIQIVAGLY